MTVEDAAAAVQAVAHIEAHPASAGDIPAAEGILVAARIRAAVDIQAGERSTPGADNRGDICDPTVPDASRVGTLRKRLT